jgi:hypothetical protein
MPRRNFGKPNVALGMPAEGRSRPASPAYCPIPIRDVTALVAQTTCNRPVSCLRSINVTIKRNVASRANRWERITTDSTLFTACVIDRTFTKRNADIGSRSELRGIGDLIRNAEKARTTRPAWSRSNFG